MVFFWHLRQVFFFRPGGPRSGPRCSLANTSVPGHHFFHAMICHTSVLKKSCHFGALGTKNHQKCPKLVLETFNCHVFFSLLGPSMRGLKPCFFSISICCHCLVFLLWLAKHGPILKYSLHQHSTYYTVLTSSFFFFF